MRKREEPFDDSSDDNHDDSEPLNYAGDSAKKHSLCLVTTPARSWQCEANGSLLVCGARVGASRIARARQIGAVADGP
jgi:hypothetical protein